MIYLSERDCTEGVRRPRTTGEDHVSVGKAVAKLFRHFDLEDGDTEEALGKCKVPGLFIHGEDDRLVPCEIEPEKL